MPPMPSVQCVRIRYVWGADFIGLHDPRSNYMRETPESVAPACHADVAMTQA